MSPLSKHLEIRLYYNEIGSINHPETTFWIEWLVCIIAVTLPSWGLQLGICVLRWPKLK